MSKVDEIKNFLIQAKPDSPERERLQQVIEAFFGLRIELIQSLKSSKIEEFKLSEAIEKAVVIRADKTATEKEKEEASEKTSKIMNEVEEQSTIEADSIIETMLKGQESFRRLAKSGQVPNNNLLKSLVPNDTSGS